MNAAAIEQNTPASGESGTLQIGDMSHDRRRGLLIVLGFFGFLLGGAALIPLDAGVVGTGVVTVLGDRQVVQHREGGVVADLRVTKGQNVKAGDLLVQISDPDVISTERSLTNQYIRLLSERARLQSNLMGNRSIDQPTEFAVLGTDDRPIASEAMASQVQLLQASRSAKATQKAVLRQQIGQNLQQIEAAKLQRDANREQRRLIDEELAGLRSLIDRGFVSMNRVRALERERAQLDGSYGALGAEIARLGESIGGFRAQMSSLDMQSTETTASDMRSIESQLGELQPRLAAAREQLERTKIRATASGKVVGLKINTIGSVVPPSSTIMEIVPEDKSLVVQARVLPSDAEFLDNGLFTQVRFPALHDRSLPILNGQVSKVSADLLSDERTGAQYFEVEVKVSPESIAQIRKAYGRNAIRPGLPAEIVVPTRRRTALDYLIEPLTKMWWKSGRES